MTRFLLRNKIVPGGLIIAFITISLFFILKDTEKKSIITKVTVVPVSLKAVESDVAFMGILAPSAQVDISAKSNGRLVSMSHDVGGRVSAGEVLAQLDGGTQRATVTGLEDTLFKIRQTMSDVEGLYSERIKSAEESLSLVKQSSSVNNGNTKSVSLLTSTAILASQVNDSLSELLAIRNGIKDYKSIPYYYALGATNASSKSKAEESLVQYQKLQTTYQTFFNEFILGKNPSEETIAKGLHLGEGLLVSGKSALADSYAMLLYTLPADQLPESQITTFKNTVTTFGSQIETLITNVRTVKSEVVQTEIGLSTLKKERDSKISEINVQASQVDAQLKVGAVTLGDTALLAPFDGVITSKMVDVGSIVSFGTPVYRLVNDSVLKVIVDVSDDLINALSLGQEAFVIVNDKKIPTKITKIHPAVNPRTSKITVELELNNADRLLTAGSLARVTLSATPLSGSVSIPRSTLISRYGLTYVFVLKDGKALKKIVKVGRQDDVSVEILQGLSEGDKVINSGALYLRDGDSAQLISDTDHE